MVAPKHPLSAKYDFLVCLIAGSNHYAVRPSSVKPSLGQLSMLGLQVIRSDDGSDTTLAYVIQMLGQYSRKTPK